MDLYFNFIGSVDDDKFRNLQHLVLSRKDISKLTICINSLGGSTTYGIGIYNFLKHLDFPVVTHNIGEVTSAAIMVFLAGSTRTAEPISKFMIHPISLSLNGNFTYLQIQEFLRNIDADIENFRQIIECETNSLNGKYNAAQILKGDSLVLNQQSAYECGIVTKM